MATRLAYGDTYAPRNPFVKREGGPGPYHGFVKDGRWTGRVELIPDQLEKPLHWRKPRRIAVALMGDLFHEALSDEDIGRVFDVMGSCPQHTFQLLSKRAERMRDFMVRYSAPGGPLGRVSKSLPNVHLGVSVEDQATADERIPLLLQTPAAVRWVSLEPLLEPVDFEKHRLPGPQIDWVVVGLETGPGARRCEKEWLRSAVRQCRDAGVPPFVKRVPGYGRDPAEWPSDLRIREFPC